jgi:hypothetical protein
LLALIGTFVGDLLEGRGFLLIDGLQASGTSLHKLGLKVPLDGRYLGDRVGCFVKFRFGLFVI